MTATRDGAGAIDRTHDPDLRSWVPSANQHPDFPIQNLPFGIFEPARPAGGEPGPRGGIRIGDEILDLRGLSSTGLLSGAAQEAAKVGGAPSLNSLFGLGAAHRKELRRQVSTLLSSGAEHRDRVGPLLSPADGPAPTLAAVIGDYTDFYAGIHHATAVGTVFRPDNPLPANYKWLPIGYHGRASTVRPSGTPVRRPNGQVRLPGVPEPVYGPTHRLDFELELGIWIGPESLQGQPIPIGRAAEHVAGYCLLNDWSARDVQAWEYQPLGPFLGKSFATTVSAWVVTPEALAPYRIPVPARPAGDPAPLPYLWDDTDQRYGALDVELEVLITTPNMRTDQLPAQRLSVSSTRHMYWSVAQLITHHTSGGCDLRSGDLLGSGTLSAPDREGCGSLLEISRGGSESVTLDNGESRTFLLDGDEIILRARAVRPGVAPIGFGECRAVVRSASPA